MFHRKSTTMEVIQDTVLTYGVPEIADELDVSINTVKTQKKIAYAKIKDQLKPGMLQAMVLLNYIIFF